MLSDLFIQELKYANNIEDVIGAYVNLKRRGKNLTGLCPFHSEKTPSFTVFPDGQSFYCFGCGAGGDVITFIKRAENLEYMEAVRFLAQRAGIQVPEDKTDDRAGRLKARVLELNRAAARHFYGNLMSSAGKYGLDYLLERGLRIETIKHFGLGLAYESWDNLLHAMRQKGFTAEELDAANLVARGKSGKQYDQFRNRIIFPIIDVRGNVIAFGGRNLGEKGPKYLNSADTPVFKKSRNLFALNFAKNTKEEAFILGEGYMDVIAMHAAGFSNAVATLGTSLTAEQARLIAHYAKEVVIAYDADGAGQTATRRAIEIFSQVGLPTRVLTVTGAKDPDEFIKKYGSARFKILLEKSANSTEYALNRLREQHNMSTADGRVAYLNAAAKYLAGFDNLIERDIYVSKLSEEAGVSRMALMETINSLAQKREKSEKRKQERDLKVEVFDPRDKINPQRAKYPKAALCEEKILSFLFSHPDHIRVVQKELSEDMFVTDFNRKVYRHTIEAFDQHKDLDIAYFGEDFTDEEMGRITRMFVQQSEMAYTLEDARSYIAALKEQKGKVSYDDMKQMSPQQLQEYLMQRKK